MLHHMNFRRKMGKIINTLAAEKRKTDRKYLAYFWTVDLVSIGIHGICLIWVPPQSMVHPVEIFRRFSLVGQRVAYEMDLLPDLSVFSFSEKD